MRLISLFLISMIFSIQAYSQNLPHKFKDGDVIYADQINDNFEYLQGVRETTVDCGSSGNGNGINKAINEGYNSIIISGICKENVEISGRKNKIGLIKLRGLNNDYNQDKIIDNSSNEASVLGFFWDSIFVQIDNLSIIGGLKGIQSFPNVNFRINDVKIEGYESEGLRISGGSMFSAKNLIIDGSNNSSDNNQRGIGISSSSMAFLDNITIIGNQKQGLNAWQSRAWMTGNIAIDNNGIGVGLYSGSSLEFDSSSITNISNNSRGIESSLSNLGLNGQITISNSEQALSFNQSAVTSGAELEISNNQYGINIYLSSLETWDSSKTLITNTSTGKAFWAGRSQLSLRNIDITGIDSLKRIYLPLEMDVLVIFEMYLLLILGVMVLNSIMLRAILIT